MPRGIPNSKTIDAPAEYLGKEQAGVIGEIGNDELEVLDKPVPKSFMDTEAFMNEVVTVIVHDSTDPNARDVEMVAVNGVTQYFRRGHEQKVKRKYVERLARMKETAYMQNLDLPGEAVNFMRQRHNLKFPFSVTHDPNPNGPAWLKAVLAEGQ